MVKIKYFMKFVIIGLLSIFFNICYGVSLDIEISPKKPRAEEPYTVYFKVESENLDSVEIKFDTKNLKVLDKTNQGVQSRTTIINGNIERSRTLTYAYEVQSIKEGHAQIFNVKVIGDSKEHSFGELKYSVYSKLEESKKEYFAKVEIDNLNPYIGEAMHIRYYLYSKRQISTPQIKKFPQLLGFIKRYHNDGVRPQKVQFKGQWFHRYMMYSTTLFPEKVGNLKVDSMSFIVRQSSLSSFGFGWNGTRDKTIFSGEKSINVRSLPVGATDSFTGLVGEFNFDLKVRKNRFIVNEPIEIKLEVSGDGLLENFPAPDLFKNNDFEKFDSSSNFEAKKNTIARKTFNYTYLVKKPLVMRSFQLPLSYFSTKQNKYITKYLNFPDFKIAGTAVPMNTSDSSNIEQNINTNKVNRINSNFIWSWGKTTSKWWYLFIGLFIGLIINFIRKQYQEFRKNKKTNYPQLSQFKKGEFSYGDLFQFFNQLNQSKYPIDNALINDNLSEDTRTYFKNLIDKVTSNFDVDSINSGAIEYRENAFKEVIKYYADH